MIDFETDDFDRDVLYEMASVGELPLPPAEEQIPSRKRARDESEGLSAATSVLVSDSPTHSVANPTDLMNTPCDPALPEQLSPDPSAFTSFTLPLSSEELGRLPVYLQNPPVPLSPNYPSPSESRGVGSQLYISTFDHSQSASIIPSSQYSAAPFNTEATLGDPDSLTTLDDEIYARGSAPPTASDNHGGHELSDIWSAMPSGFE